ncbi:Differentially expressed in FDCP 8 [Folsomia candida]|uniref:Differentially expressed in FDCP 8 n=1 Tax=Folsomia candida TaxID=158441 RepID=A0A226F354_FOLCA|nr:Differentially expressed in FDCP 8 [Folsomia candida]
MTIYQMVDFLKDRLNEGLGWISGALQYSPGKMDDSGDKESLWSSEDGKSHDMSLTDEAEENYFSFPIDDSLLQTPDEIEDAIERVKALVLETEGVSEERRKLVQRLISLRLRLQDVKEIQEERGENSSEELRIINHHQFIHQNQIVHRSPQYCDRCGGIIWTVVQHWYRCKGIDTEYIAQICPEVGLPDQNFTCFECKTRFTLKNSWMEPRICNYNGRYFCPICHKNNSHSIPARILHNWDFEEKPVSEGSRQFLILMARKPNINLDRVNPKLFSFVEDLNIVKRYREDIIIMKDFFMTCRDAVAQKLLRRLDEKQHFVESSCMYSLQDLIDINNGTMLKFIEKIHDAFERHIKETCQICKGKGFICEICENEQVIFPFDSATHQCSSCHAVFHNICFAKRESCPKCLRKSRRALNVL